MTDKLRELVADWERDAKHQRTLMESVDAEDGAAAAGRMAVFERCGAELEAALADSAITNEGPQLYQHAIVFGTREEAEAAHEKLKAADRPDCCSICAGTRKTLTSEPCICKTGTIYGELAALREVALAASPEPTDEMVEARTVGDMAKKHRHRWLDRADDYWLCRLMQEVGELASVIAGDHPDTIEHELTQIGSIAVNWLRLRAALAAHTKQEG